jgi:hypothetical protein
MLTLTTYSKKHHKVFKSSSSTEISSAQEKWKICPLCSLGIAPQEKEVQRFKEAVIHDMCLRTMLTRNELNKLPAHLRSSREFLNEFLTAVSSRLSLWSDERSACLKNLWAFYELSFNQPPDFHLIAGYRN